MLSRYQVPRRPKILQGRRAGQSDQLVLRLLTAIGLDL